MLLHLVGAVRAHGSFSSYHPLWQCGAGEVNELLHFLGGFCLLVVPFGLGAPLTKDDEL